MAERFTGFWEMTGPHVEEEVATTLSYIEVDELLERLRVRLESAPRGAHVRIDLIAWEGEGRRVPPWPNAMGPDPDYPGES